ncbi:MAG: hypothetical protein JXB32_12280 [Deltaproteobacteria bacterium]|nr:hypothetical protein [Deltaproteobacteria bacterium]
MRSKWLPIALFVTLFGTGCPRAYVQPTGFVPGGAMASITIQNVSNYDIYQLYMSSSSDPNWGNDHLGQNILPANGGTVTLTMPCDTYDIKVIDEDGDECTMMQQPLCSDNAWLITNEELLSCEGYR